MSGPPFGRLSCSKCGAWVAPEREQLVGWHDAESLVAARENSAFACPVCGELWDEDGRRSANLQSRLVREGKTILADDKV
ncbi:MAG: phage terminase large subunit family protein [Pirellulales bacterium]